MFRTITAAAAITATLGFAGFATAAAASAGALDDQFLDAMTAEGVTYPSEEYAINAAQSVCSDLSYGYTGAEIAQDVLDVTDLTKDQAVAFVVESAFTYCPEYTDTLVA